MSWSAPDTPEQCCTGLATSISHMCAQPKTSLKPAQTEPSPVPHWQAPGTAGAKLSQSFPGNCPHHLATCGQLIS